VRATVLIDLKGIIRYYSLNDLPLGRNISEILRIIDALQHSEKYGEVCPAGWNLGKQAIKPTLDGIQNYLKNNYKDTL
jgi:peroxiredoxin (alkyl hydroperoxide reductase subunit C)